MKGRAVLLGDNVKDQDFNWAEFCEPGSSPPSTEAATLRGYIAKTGDARGAYTQSLLRGADTWVAVPEHRWPTNWKKKFRRPVVQLILALYGHTDAGGFWEEHCENQLFSIGWCRLAEEWPGV